MNTNERKIEKPDMKNICGGAEKDGKTGNGRNTPGNSDCGFNNGNCCRRTDCHK